MSLRAAALLALLVPARARADAEEASLHVELGPALMQVGDANGHGVSATAPGLRFGVRGTYGLSDLIAVEVGLSTTLGYHAQFEDQMVPPPSTTQGTQQLDELALRATVGVTARLGVAKIPTLTVFGGYQHRSLIDISYLRNGAPIGSQSSVGASDLIVGLGLGFDFRLGNHWIVGLSLQYVHAFSFGSNDYDAAEMPVHAGYYWYPRWFGEGWMPGGEPITGP